MAGDVGVWRFKTEQPGRWVWRQISPGGDVLLASDEAFPSIELCAVDAERCGYAGILGAYATLE